MRRRMISLMRRSIWRFRNLNLEECKKDAMFYDSEGGGNCPDREERITSVEFVRDSIEVCRVVIHQFAGSVALIVNCIRKKGKEMSI